MFDTSDYILLEPRLHSLFTWIVRTVLYNKINSTSVNDLYRLLLILQRWVYSLHISPLNFIEGFNVILFPKTNITNRCLIHSKSNI